VFEHGAQLMVVNSRRTHRMKERRDLPELRVIVDEKGVHTTPRIMLIESKLALLAKTFSGDKPWSLVVSPNGEIDEVVGFTGNELVVGDVIGQAVLGFMSELDPRGDGLYIEAALLVAQAVAQMPNVEDIDWDETHFTFQNPFPETLIFSRLIGQTSLVMPGAPYGSPYRDDVNSYLKEIFLTEVNRVAKCAAVERFLISAVHFVKGMRGLGKAGLTAPSNLSAFFAAFANTSPSMDPSSENMEALIGRYFGELFPEYSFPFGDAEVNLDPIVMLYCEHCQQEGLAGTNCTKCGRPLPSKTEVFADARGDAPADVPDSEAPDPQAPETPQGDGSPKPE